MSGSSSDPIHDDSQVIVTHALHIANPEVPIENNLSTGVVDCQGSCQNPLSAPDKNGINSPIVRWVPRWK